VNRRTSNWIIEVDALSYCPKCGNKIEEDMVFCPKCGASLKGEQAAVPPPPVTYRHEKDEKHEKHEKGEYAFIGPLIGGLILIFIGLSAYLSMTGMVESRVWGAVFFIAVGIIIIVGVIYGAVLASRRHPKA
jgi:uncharacterized membrane protein YvbJ